MRSTPLYVCCVALSIFSVLCGCATPGQAPRAEPPSAEVFVIGGIHQDHERAKLYTYARMGELVKLIKPDVLCVEVLPENLTNGTDKGMPWDFKRSMVPNAREMGIPIVGVDWWNDVEGERWQALQHQAFNDPSFAPEVTLYGNMFEQLGQYFRERDFAEINSDEVTALWKTKNAFKYQLFRRKPEYHFIVDFEMHRNAEILANVERVLTRYPGKRVLVALGIDHKYALEDALRQRGVRVLTVSEVLAKWQVPVSQP